MKQIQNNPLNTSAFVDVLHTHSKPFHACLTPSIRPVHSHTQYFDYARLSRLCAAEPLHNNAYPLSTALYKSMLHMHK